MATFVLIHGAGDTAWYWHLVEPELRKHGHDVVAPDLPCEDDGAGLPEYADAVVQAIGQRKDLTVVAQSFGGFTAPLVCEQVPVDLLVLVAAMVPKPGEAPNDFWLGTNYESAKLEAAAQSKSTNHDHDIFFHEVPPDIAKEAMRRERGQSDARMGEPWPLESWPDVPTGFLLCRGDRLFPPHYMRRVAAERLGITPDEIDGGHCIALSRPKELADRLHGYLS